MTSSTHRAAPATWRRAAVGAVLVALLVAVTTGCSADAVEIPPPDLDRADQTACESFAAALPEVLVEESRTETVPAEPLGGAYGDPAIVVRCGVEVPPEFDRLGQCEEINGVGWWAPPEQYDDQDVDVTLFLVGYAPAVELAVPADYRPDGVAAALAGLTDAVKGSMELVRRCV